MTKPTPTLIIDTREKLPGDKGTVSAYTFEGYTTIRQCLPSGDYSVLGYETVAAVERKSLDDLVGSLTQGRERFERELERLKPYKLKVLMIEGTVDDIMKHRYTSQAHPNSIMGSLVAFQLDYGLDVIYAGNRDYAERYTLKLLVKFWERKQRPATLPVVDTNIIDEITRHRGGCFDMADGAAAYKDGKRPRCE